MFTPEYLLGLFFIVLVALIWAASSVVAQLVYSSDSFDSPFLLTYMGTSLFTLWLPIHFSTEWCTKVKSSSSDSENNNNIGSNSELLNSTHYESVGRESPVHSDGEEEEDEDEANNMQQLSPVDSPPLRQQEEAWTNEDHFRVALRIAPVWFIANWAYNASLLYTTITSSTVLASTSALFTFIFAVLCKDESFLMIKLAGVLLGVSGGILTALHDASADKDHMDDPSNTKNGDEQDPLFLLGDLLGILSAVGYGAYAVQTRIFCPKDESLYSMQVLLGYIGLLNMTVLSPVAIYIMMSSSHVELVVLGCVLLKGLFDNFLSDYLWLRSVLLTNATVATVGLGLTIPLAFLSDLVMGKSNIVSAGSLLGALTVLGGFILVNVGTEKEREKMEADDNLHHAENSRADDCNHVEMRDGSSHLPALD